MLQEIMIYILCFGILSSVVAVTTYQAHEDFHRARRALDDLEHAGRLLSDLKRDLRFASTVTLPGGALTLPEAVYRFDPAEYAVVRVSAAGIRGYGSAVESITFTDLGDNLIQIDLAIRKRNADSPFHPTWSAVVHCRNRAP